MVEGNSFQVMGGERTLACRSGISRSTSDRPNPAADNDILDNSELWGRVFPVSASQCPHAQSQVLKEMVFPLWGGKKSWTQKYYPC